MVEWNIVPVRSKIFTSFWDMGDRNLMILVGVAPHKAYYNEYVIL